MKNSRKITQADLEKFFQQELGKSTNDLLGKNKYARYTRDGNDMLIACFTHFTGWKMNSVHGLHIRDEQHPEAFLAHPKVTTMNDLPDLGSYLAKINEMRTDAPLHQRIIQQGVEKHLVDEEKKVIEAKIEAYLHEKNRSSIDHVLSLKEPERSGTINDILRSIAHTSIQNGDVHIIDPKGTSHQQTHSRDFELSHVSSKEHLVHLVHGSKENRDQFLFLASPHVRRNLSITLDSVQAELKARTDKSLEEVIEGTKMTTRERIQALNTIHFYFSEVLRDSDGDLVFPKPGNVNKVVSIKNVSNPERYYEEMNSVEAFMEKVMKARKQRDHYYEYEQIITEDIDLTNRIERLQKKNGRGNGEMERW